MAVLALVSLLFSLAFGSFIGDKFSAVVHQPWERLGELSEVIDHHFDSHRTKSEVGVLVNQTAYEALQKMGFSLSKIETSFETARSLFPEKFADYHDYNELTQFLQDYSTRFSNITQLFTLGKSVSGREQWGIKITDNPTQIEKGEPQFIYFGNIHGDETVGREMLVLLIADLCENYGRDGTITSLIDSTEIYIVPSINPDGFERARRANDNGYDLNRDFPDQFTDPNNDPAGRQPETRNVMNFFSKNNFVLGANLHGGTLCVNYPLDSLANQAQCGRIISYSEDHDLYIDISLTYSRLNPPMYASREFSQGITNGAEWYCVYGGLQDWSYVWYGSLHVTVELSNIKYPPASELDGFWDDNREALLAYVQWVHRGVKGTVTSRTTGQALRATITVAQTGHEVFTRVETGDYFRVLLPGTYTVTASATGYTPQSKQVTVTSGAAAILDFAL